MRGGKAERVFIFLITVAFSIFGLLLTSSVLSSYFGILFSKNWQKVSAKLVEFKIKTGSSGGKYSKRYYKPVVRYEYNVRGFTYSGDTISWSRSHQFDSQSDALEFVDNPVSDDFIMIKYDPEKPYRSVFKDKLPKSDKRNLIGGSGLQMPLLIWLSVKRLNKRIDH